MRAASNAERSEVQAREPTSLILMLILSASYLGHRGILYSVGEVIHKMPALDALWVQR